MNVLSKCRVTAFITASFVLGFAVCAIASGAGGRAPAPSSSAPKLAVEKTAFGETPEGEQVVSIQTNEIALLSANLNDPESTLSKIEQTQESVSAYRASLGSNMNTLETSAKLLQNKSEQVLNSVSRISDTDMAATITSLISDQITAKQAVSVQAHSEVISQIAASIL